MTLILPVPVIHLDRGASLPALKVWWPDDTPSGGVLHDFSTGWTFTGAIGLPGETAVVSLVGGQFTGAAGSGDGYGDDDEPNLTLLLSNADAAALTARAWQLDLVATRGDTRVMRRRVRLVIDEIVG